MKNRHKLTLISTLHYLRLVYRSVLFILLLIEYISDRIHPREFLEDALVRQPLIYILIWVVFVAEMILRFFPSRYESPGCQKQFKRNYIKSGKTDIRKGFPRTPTGIWNAETARRDSAYTRSSSAD